MTSPQSNDGPQSACIAIYFLISLALSLLLYWTSWQGWVETNDTYWRTLAYCAPFPAAVWLGACAIPLSSRQALMLGLLAGCGGFLLHLLIYAARIGDLISPTWTAVLGAFALGGLFLCPFGLAVGRRFLAKPALLEPQRASAPVHPHGHVQAQTSAMIYVQTALGFLGPIIVAMIDRRAQ